MRQHYNQCVLGEKKCNELNIHSLLLLVFKPFALMRYSSNHQKLSKDQFKIKCTGPYLTVCSSSLLKVTQMINTCQNLYEIVCHFLFLLVEWIRSWHLVLRTIILRKSKWISPNTMYRANCNTANNDDYWGNMGVINVPYWQVLKLKNTVLKLGICSRINYVMFSRTLLMTNLDVMSLLVMVCK